MNAIKQGVYEVIFSLFQETEGDISSRQSDVACIDIQGIQCTFH